MFLVAVVPLSKMIEVGEYGGNCIHHPSAGQPAPHCAFCFWSHGIGDPSQMWKKVHQTVILKKCKPDSFSRQVLDAFILVSILLSAVVTLVQSWTGSVGWLWWLPHHSSPQPGSQPQRGRPPQPSTRYFAGEEDTSHQLLVAGLECSRDWNFDDICSGTYQLQASKWNKWHGTFSVIAYWIISEGKLDRNRGGDKEQDWSLYGDPCWRLSLPVWTHLCLLPFKTCSPTRPLVGHCKDQVPERDPRNALKYGRSSCLFCVQHTKCKTA